jgi:hypothetical protein
VFASRVVVVNGNRSLRSLRDQLAGFVAGLEPGIYSGADAAGAVAVLVEIERLAGAGKALLAARVADTSVWAGGGHRSPAHWLARQSGTSVGEAGATLAAVAALAVLADTDQAFRAGKLSGPQTREITAAAAINPEAEAGLLAAAERESLRHLRERAQRARTAGQEGVSDGLCKCSSSTEVVIWR